MRQFKRLYIILRLSIFIQLGHKYLHISIFIDLAYSKLSHNGNYSGVFFVQIGIVYHEGVAISCIVETSQTTLMYMIFYPDSLCSADVNRHNQRLGITH